MLRCALLLLLPAEAFARPVEDLSHKEDVFKCTVAYCLDIANAGLC